MSAHHHMTHQIPDQSDNSEDDDDDVDVQVATLEGFFDFYLIIATFC
jgi:hypothetical protein